MSAARQRILAATLLTVLWPAHSLAQSPAPPDRQPVLLDADELSYDEAAGIITAKGKVELSQGQRLMLADEIRYSDKTDVVTASGNISIQEPSGEVIFAEYVELTDDMKQGFIDQVRILLTDNARIAAAEGERIEGRYTRLERVVYSPCDLCKDDPDKPPLWQIRASRITHDQVAKDINYRDAMLEVAGVPVAYLPFFGHPDPTVDRRSGFMTPSGGVSSDLGTYARVYYFVDIDADKDATLEVTPSTKDGLLLGGEYRQAVAGGGFVLTGSATYADRERMVGGVTMEEKDFRGHIFGSGRFEIDDRWRWGFDAARVTDNTHLLRYDYSKDDLLKTRLFAERFEGRSYAAINAYSFQDLRPGSVEEEPWILPAAEFQALGEPGEVFGGRWSVDGGLLSLLRTDGTDTRRLSGGAGWRAQRISDLGLVSTAEISARADAYWVDDYARPGTTVERDGITDVRLFSQAHLSVGWPLARQEGTVQQLLEPMVALTLAPNVENDGRLPNEDSLDVEFDHTNLFAPSRFPGYDRLDGGQRLTYGVKAGLYGFGGGSSSLFLGQSYRLQRQNDFPRGSGLETELSDWVGRIEITPSPWLDLSYNFRLDSQNFAQRRHDVFGVFGPPSFRVNASYIYLDRQTLDNGAALRNREELAVGANSSISRFWSVGVNHRRDLGPDGGPTSTGIVLTYQDECLRFQLVGERDYTERTGIDGGDRIFFRVSFKNLGAFLSPSLSSDSLRDVPR